MALLANAAYHRKDMDIYHNFISYFKEQATLKDFSKMDFESTIVRSSGEARNREMVAYWIVALLKDKNNVDVNFLMKCLNYISKGKTAGGFGNTQATSVCLQALTKYTIFVGSENKKGDLHFTVNNEKEVIELKNQSGVNYDFTEKLKAGRNAIALEFIDSNPFPYAINISWFSSLPSSSDLCPLRLSCEMKSTEVKVNETVRLSVRLENTEDVGKPMSVAIVGIPGGMSLQAWQLKEMQETGVFDFYEIINDNLVIYYRELGPNEKKIIDLDLKAEIPGIYTGTASSAYIYYMDQYKHWIKGIEVDIRE